MNFAPLRKEEKCERIFPGGASPGPVLKAQVVRAGYTAQLQNTVTMF
jgi:hypothetical protein